MTFRSSQHLTSRLEGLKKYLEDAPFVLFSGRTRGGYDGLQSRYFHQQKLLTRKVTLIEICSEI